jgi:hypothetical protein
VRRNAAFFWSDNKWRGQQDVVAVHAVHAALCWIREHSLVHGGLKDFSGNIVFARERRISSFLFYELNARQQAQTANVADVRMLFQRFQRSKEFSARVRDSCKQRLLLQHIQHGVARRH